MSLHQQIASIGKNNSQENTATPKTATKSKNGKSAAAIKRRRPLTDSEIIQIIEAWNSDSEDEALKSLSNESQ